MGHTIRIRRQTYEEIARRYTLSSPFQVCCRRFHYEGRMRPYAQGHPLALSRQRWLVKRHPKGFDFVTAVMDTMFPGEPHPNVG